MNLYSNDGKNQFQSPVPGTSQGKESQDLHFDIVTKLRYTKEQNPIY